MLRHLKPNEDATAKFHEKPKTLQYALKQYMNPSQQIDSYIENQETWKSKILTQLRNLIQ